MSTLPEVKASQKRIDEAQGRLREYIERPSSDPTDTKLHLRLGEELKQAIDDYVLLVANLGR